MVGHPPSEAFQTPRLELRFRSQQRRGRTPSSARTQQRSRGLSRLQWTHRTVDRSQPRPGSTSRPLCRRSPSQRESAHDGEPPISDGDCLIRLDNFPPRTAAGTGSPSGAAGTAAGTACRPMGSCRTSWTGWAIPGLWAYDSIRSSNPPHPLFASFIEAAVAQSRLV